MENIEIKKNSIKEDSIVFAEICIIFEKGVIHTKEVYCKKNEKQFKRELLKKYKQISNSRKVTVRIGEYQVLGKTLI